MWTVCCSVPNITFIGALCCLCGAKNPILDHWVNAVPTCCPEGRLAGNQSVSRSQWFKESTWWPRYDHWTDNAQTAWRRQPMHIWPSRRTINKTYITELTSFQAADGKLAIFVFAFVENWPNESTSTVQWTSDKLQHCCQSFIRVFMPCNTLLIRTDIIYPNILLLLLLLLLNSWPLWAIEANDDALHMFISITFTETSIDETNITQQKVRGSKFMFKMSTGVYCTKSITKVGRHYRQLFLL